MRLFRNVKKARRKGKEVTADNIAEMGDLHLAYGPFWKRSHEGEIGKRAQEARSSGEHAAKREALVAFLNDHYDRHFA